MAGAVKRLEDVIGITGAQYDGSSGSMKFSSVVTDSRNAVPGSLFFALRGSARDGREFAQDAVARGAVAVVAESGMDAIDAPVLIVPDALEALQKTGAAFRSAFSGPVVAVTGSAGKTTTRELVASILSQRMKTLTPQSNFNNHVGVPLTLCRLTDEYEAAVVELGMSGFGEIALLTGLVKPDIGIVTNAGRAHIENLGSVDGVARAKGELLVGLDESAAAVVNGDDARVVSLPTTASKRVVFGHGRDSDVRIESCLTDENGMGVMFTVSGDGIIEARMKLLGEHNALNAAAAVAAAWCLETPAGDMKKGLEAVRPVRGRLQMLTGRGGSLILDDTYNANPESTAAALDIVKGMKRRRVIALADMLELGDQARAAHIETGHTAARTDPAFLLTYGLMAESIHAGALEAGLESDRLLHVRTHEEAISALMPWDRPDTVILVKGSRGMKMENVVQGLAARGDA